jgi:hypothetical protein
MIDAKQAVAIAMTYFRSLFNADILSDILSDILLEEVELSDDEKAWTVTLSALLPVSKDELNETALTAIAEALATREQRRRVYKVFKINSEKARVQSMKIRQPHERSFYH